MWNIFIEITIFIIAQLLLSNCIALCLQKDIFIAFLVSRLLLSFLFFTAIVAPMLDIYASL